MPRAHNTTDSSREDVLAGFHFKVEVGGKVAGYFTEAAGIGSSNEVIEHKVVNEQGIEHIQKIPGRMTFEDITLKRGITSSLDIWEWRKQVEDGEVGKARTDGSIVMYDQELKEIARWNFENAWPAKVSGPSFNAGSADVGIEELVITHEHMYRES